MKDELLNVKNHAISQITEAKDLTDLEQIRVSYLGRKGKLSEEIKKIKSLNEKDKKEIGILINDIKATLQSFMAEKETSFKDQDGEWFDETIPGIKPQIGNYHLITSAINEISDIFGQLGFNRVRYMEVEW